MMGSNKKPSRTVIIGFGQQAERAHLPALCTNESNFELVGCVDVSHERRAKAKALCPNLVVSEHLEKVLEATNPEVVVVATPPYWRVQPIKCAKSYGVQKFICEKPIAHTRMYLNLLQELSHNLLIYPCHTWRKSQVYRKAIAAIQKGVIGTIRRVVLETQRSGHAKGCGEWLPKWRIQPEFSGGGILMDHGYHYFYLLAEILNQWPLSLYVNDFSKNRYNTVEDSCELYLNFSGGCRAIIRLNWCANERKILNYFEGDSGRLEISEESVVIVRPNGSRKIVFQGKPLSSDSIHAEWYREIYKNFSEKIQRSETNCKEFDTAVATMSLLFDAYNSMVF